MLGFFLICLHNQLSYIGSVITYYGYSCFQNVIHQIDSKNEWLLLSANFTAKVRFVFVVA